MAKSEVEADWVSMECTLPTEEVPLRVAEFEDVFAQVRATERPEPTRLVLMLQTAPGRAEQVQELAARESECCSFFGFTVREEDHALVLDVTVPPAQIRVLDAIAERVERVTRAAVRT